MPEARHDPYLNFNFVVEIDGAAVGGFAEVDAPEGRIEVAAYRDGSERQNTIRRLPGRVTYGPLIPRRGFSADRTLFQWWRAVAEGDLDRRNVAVILRDQSGHPVARWNFSNALPMKYDGPDFRAHGNDVAIESLELAIEDMELATKEDRSGAPEGCGTRPRPLTPGRETRSCPGPPRTTDRPRGEIL
jgi:phage tail-like protein